MDMLLLIDDDKSHYVYIKDFDRFMFHKTKNKNKKWFFRSCLQCLNRESVLIKHKENCLSINGKQSVKLEKGIIKFENYFKQIPVPFKIYADFECNLRSVESYEGSYTKKYQDHIPCSFAYKLFVLMIGLLSQLFSLEVKMVTGKFGSAAHWSCNIDLQLTKKGPVIFHKLRGYDSHLIFR